MEITGTIKNTVFQNKETGYTVLRTKQDITLCGVLYDSASNLNEADFTAEGTWQKHKSFGRQFQFETLTIIEGELLYFLSRIVKGLGRKLAKHLIETYGDDELENILEHNPQKLIETKGIKEKKLKKIMSSWNKFKHLKAIAGLIIPFGGTQTLVKRIYIHYKDDPDVIKKMKENPYVITEVKGIGFKTADKMVRAMGIDPHSPIRIKACIDFIILSYTINGGNSCIHIETLFTLLNEEIAFADAEENIVSISKEEFDRTLLEMQDDKKIVALNDSTITSTFLYFAETFILETVRKKGQTKSVPIIKDIDSYVAQKEKEMAVTFDEVQKQALILANEGYELLILCGYAGTGKSTISRAVLDILSQRFNKDDIICCAISGIAADRIRKTSGYQSATIQSLLVKIKTDEDKLPYKVMLIDEASMVNSELLYKLFKVTEPNTLFILVGDPAQLPPIGAGDPFHDIITLSIAPTIELTKIYRQSDDKVIAVFANQIRQAEVPKDYEKKYDDFEFMDVSIKNYFNLRQEASKEELQLLKDENTNQILTRILALTTLYKDPLMALLKTKDIRNFVTFFQLITPIKSGMLGAENLNLQLQEILNPERDEPRTVDLGMTIFHLMDKVVHISNQDMDCYTPEDFKRDDREDTVKKNRIFNGMIGLLFKIDKEDELLWVFYPNDELVVEYSFDEARELLRLAYALTIHKTQGSEYQNIIIPIVSAHFMMLNNKLLYTAITRAKEKCMLVGEGYAFKSACKRKDATVRTTVIKVLNPL